MPQVDRPIQRSFAFGELSPYLEARADLDRFKSSLAICQNCVTLPQGGATKRSGTMRIWEALANSTLLSFKFSRSDGYAIEAAASKFRFFRDYGIVMKDDNSAPYELATPFLAAEIPNLYFTQSANWMYLSSGARPIQKLIRSGHTNWNINAANITGGPFLDENADDTIYCYTNDAAELIKNAIFTLKSSADIFLPGHVGAQWLLKIGDSDQVGTWKTQQSFELGTIIRWGANYYKCVGQYGQSGANPPLHTAGAKWDGSITGGSEGGRKWLYLHSGWGIVTITAYGGPRQVTAKVQSYVPRELYASGAMPDTGGSNRWAEGAWSDVRGYPKAVVLHQGRLLAASSTYEPSKWWAGCYEDYENFLAGSEDTMGFARALTGDDEFCQILWMISGRRLAIGTSGPEFVVQASTNRQLLTPSNAYTDPATGEGSASIRPVRIDVPIFVTKDGLRLIGLGLDANGEDYVGEDLTLFADHISESGFAGIAWQRDPYRLLWAWRNDGMLVCFTYRKDQGVQGWHRHPMTYQGVKSAACAPSPSGIRQDLWMIVERALPAGTKRYVECLMPFFEKGDLSVSNGWFVDCGSQYSGAPVTDINVGSDFNGADLWVLADGKFPGALHVTDGHITLPRAASKVIWGLEFDAQTVSLPYDRNYDGGANSGRKLRVTNIAVKLRNSCMVNASADTAEETEPLLPTGGGIMGAAPSLFSGVMKASSLAGDWDTGGIVRVVSKGPFPMTILSQTPILQVATN